MTHPVHQPHDKGYKFLLKNKETFLQLLRSFVPAPWVHNIDPQSLVLVDKSYITQEFADKEADIENICPPVTTGKTTGDRQSH